MSQTLKNSFTFALRRSLPIMVGFSPVGAAYGILMAQAGYGPLWTALCGVIVLAGSLQMLMVSFFLSQPPLFTVAVTALLINSRHIFYGLSFIEKFREYGPWKYYLIYGMCDENYSLLCSYRHQEGLDEKWVHIFSTALVAGYWITFSTLGGLAGQNLPFDTTGIDFALTALFIVILLEQLRGSATPVPALAATGSSLLWLILLGPDGFLLPALLTTVAVLALLRPRLEPVLDAKEGKA